MLRKLAGSAAALVIVAATAQAQAPGTTHAPTASTARAESAEKPSNSLQAGYDRHEYDLDHDGTLDLAEIKSAAAYEFDKLDVDHDGTLSRKELGHRLGAAEFSSADADKHHALNKAEYLKIVEDRFNAANADHDQALETSELATPAGRRLRQLLP